MRILITGDSGFIGSHLKREIDKQGFDVNGYSVKNGFDILDTKLLSKNLKGIDVVFHLAAEIDTRTKNDRMFEVNTLGTLNVLEAARKNDVKRMIFASSAAVYGDVKEKCKEDLVCRPKSVYGASKLAAESYVNVYNECYGLSTISLRYFNVYGPGGTSVINKFIERAKNNKPVIKNGDGKSSRDYIHVDDIIRANILAMKSKDNGIFNIGTGFAITLNDMINNISGALGEKLKITEEPINKEEIKYSCADVKKSANILGFKSEIELRKGIFELVKYYS